MSPPSRDTVLFYVDGGRVGDMLNLLPGIRRLRACFPESAITWMTGYEKSSLNTVLAPLADGLVDEFIDHSGAGAGWRQVIVPFSPRHFTIIIDCQTRIRCSLALRRLSHDTFVTSAAGYRLSDRKPESAVRPKAVLAKFLQLIELASGRRCEPDFETRLPDNYRRAAQHLLPDGPTYVGLAPGAGDTRKCWPLARFIEVAARQASLARVPVFFLGPDEERLLPEIRAAVPAALFPEYAPLDAIERSPVLTIALAERIQAGIANDSGVGHMLGAARIPLATLFGHTDAEKFVVFPSPAWKPVCAQGSEGSGIASIPTSVVSDAVEELLARGGGRAAVGQPNS